MPQNRVLFCWRNADKEDLFVTRLMFVTVLGTAFASTPLAAQQATAPAAAITTAQAVEEAKTARAMGYHAVLLSLAALKGASEDELIEHCSAVAREMPLIGFYLQTYLRMIDYSAASTVLLVTVAMVMVIDGISSRLRARLV